MKNIARTQSSTTVHSLVVLKFKGTDKLGKEEQERCKTESVQEVNQTSWASLADDSAERNSECQRLGLDQKA